MIRRLRSELRYRWRALTRRADVEEELDVELRSHLEHESARLQAEGMSPDEAGRAARVAFGSFEATKEEARDARGLVFIEQLWADLRYAARSLRLRPVLTAGVITALALGVGMNATMFGIADRLMFRAPQGLITPDRVHRVYLRWTQDGEGRVDRTMQFPRFLDFRQHTSSVDETVAYAVREMAVGAGIETKEVRVAATSANFFSLFNVVPVAGRWYDVSDDQVPTGTAVTVLSYEYWQSAYGGQTSVLGAQLRIGQMTATIIGVAPEGFTGFAAGAGPIAYVPITAYAFSLRGAAYESSYRWGWLELFVRRRQGTTVQDATADLTAAFIASWRAEEASIGRELPIDVWRPVVELGPVQLGRGPEAVLEAKLALALSGVALLVLLIAVANVANLLLARAVSRRREIAMRLALGVGRARLVRQLLTEALLLGLGGALVGLIIATTSGGVIRSLLLAGSSDVAVITDSRTLFYAVAIALLAGLGAGVLPAMQSLKADVGVALRSGGRGTERRTRVRSVLVVMQAALSMALLVGAGLFVRSLQNAESYRLGYDVDGVLYAEANLRGTKLNDDEQQQLALRMLAAAETMPGVESASLTLTVPFWSQESRGFTVPGVDSLSKLGRFVLQAGTPDYFRTTGTRIVRGRGFEPGDSEGALPVVVVGEDMARAIWPGEEAIGKCIALREDKICREVVGVAEAVQLNTLDASGSFVYYLPILQFRGAMSGSLYVRSGGSGGAGVTLESLRAILQRVMPGEAFVRIVQLRELVAPAIQPWRFGATMFVVFGVLAACLATVGLYSVISYDVAQRERELGVRRALGATATLLFTSVVSRGVRLVLAGITIGVIGAVMVARWGRYLLFQQSPDDPVLIGVVAVGLAAVAVVACTIPAVRAGRVDPCVSLRGD